MSANNYLKVFARVHGVAPASHHKPLRTMREYYCHEVFLFDEQDALSVQTAFKQAKQFNQAYPEAQLSCYHEVRGLADIPTIGTFVPEIA